MAGNLKVPVNFIIDNAKNKQKIMNSLKELQKNAKLEIDIEVELEEVKSAKKEISNLSLDIKKVADEVEKVNDTKGFSALTKEFKKNFTDLTSFPSIYKSTIGFAKKVSTEVISLNKSMVDLQQITGYSDRQTKELLKTYIDIGKQLGVGSKEVIANADAWLKQGHSITETTSLVKNAIILSKIIQLEASESTKYLTNIINGQKLAASEVLGVVDKLAATNLKSSLDTSGIAAAMSITSSSAHLAGVNLDNLIGYLTAVGEITQKDMSSIGQSFEEIFAKYGTIKLGDFIDENGMDISGKINTMETLLANAGITLRKTGGDFKDFDTVIKEISSNWSHFSRLEQNALVDTLAGSSNRESFVTLMKNYGDALEYAGVAADSSGLAFKKFDIYSNGLEASLERFGTSFESLSSTLMDDNFLKFLIDSGSGAINILDTIADKLGGLGTLLTAGIGISSTKGLGKKIKVYNALSYKVV